MHLKVFGPEKSSHFLGRGPDFYPLTAVCQLHSLLIEIQKKYNITINSVECKPRQGLTVPFHSIKPNPTSNKTFFNILDQD